MSIDAPGRHHRRHGAGRRQRDLGQRKAGVSISGTATTGVVILGNRIGTDYTGTVALGNGTFGVS